MRDTRIKLLAISIAAAAMGGCGSPNQDPPGLLGQGGASSGGTQSSGMGSVGQGGTGTGGETGAGGTEAPGGPGCGFESAAFCETFDKPSATPGRSGELSPNRWSGGRFAPQGPTEGGQAFAVGQATLRPERVVDSKAAKLPACRPDVPAQVSPDDDTLICDPSADIGSSHLLVAVASQNYGENSYRIRQPFDFAGRTGTIAFDAEAHASLGWISLDVTEDPVPVPSYSIGPAPFVNQEGGATPKNGFALQFNGDQGGVLRTVVVFNDHKETDIHTNETNLVPTATAWGKLNHFEVTVSQKRIEVFASPPSEDGVQFEPAALIYSADVDLPFSRGYVHITTHNHASLKYSTNEWSGNGGFTNLDAWIARWDNVGFDGPVLSHFREYEVPDALTPFDGGGETATNTGYLVADESAGPGAALYFKGVDLSGAKSARIALASWYCNGCGDPVEKFVLRYRLNGKEWRDRPLTPGEIGYLTGGTSQGGITQMLDVPLSDLKDGDNTLELISSNVSQGYPPGVTDIDLVLYTD